MIRKGIVKRAIIFLVIFASVVVTQHWMLKAPPRGSASPRVHNCSCFRNRRHFYHQSNLFSSERSLHSTCSDEGTFYQSGQKVVSMSFYGTDPKNSKLYLEGLTLNVKMMKKLYPGTSLRLYTDVNLKDKFCDVYCKNPELFWCDIRKTPSLGDQSEMFGMTWRFLPLGDPTVEYFLSRDLDSIITTREVAVLHEWMNTTKPFQLMRDHPDHNAPILGGMWGARNYMLGLNEGEKIREKIIKLAKKSRYQSKGADQYILNEAVYYPMKQQILAFDSYHCRIWTQTEVVPFPTKRLNNATDFVGNVELGTYVYKLQKCPVECRPEYGKDWELC